VLCVEAVSDQPSSRFRGRLRAPLSLASYARRYAFWTLVFWLAVLWWWSSASFYWMSQDGLIDQAATLGLTVWNAFCAGLGTACMSTSQPRRKLLLGRLEPTAREWSALEQGPGRSLAFGFWGPALLIALLLAALLGGAQALLGALGGRSGYPRHLFRFYTMLLPALAAAAVAWRMSRASIRRFVAAMERAQPLALPRWRYALLHNVIPYTLFNSAVGLAAAFARFGVYYQRGIPVPIHTLALHLAITGLLIALLVVGAARFKTRLDLLSPIVITSAKPLARRTRWNIWFALAVPLVTYLGLRLAFGILGVEEVGAATAIALKVPVCLAICFSTAYWAVTSTLADMEARGLDQHPYVRLHRFLRTTGNLGKGDLDR